MSGFVIFAIFCLAIASSASAGLAIAAALMACAGAGHLAVDFFLSDPDSFWRIPVFGAAFLTAMSVISILWVVFFSDEMKPGPKHSNW
jgi:hypothetical protein